MIIGVISFNSIKGSCANLNYPCSAVKLNDEFTKSTTLNNTEDIRCRQGQNIQLVCETNKTKNRVDFRYNNNIIASNRKPFDYKYKLEEIYRLWQLEIRDVTISDAGIYQCIINGEVSKTYKVIVFVPPKINKLISIPSRFHKGNNVIVVCESISEPFATTSLTIFDKRSGRLREYIEGPVHVFRNIDKRLDVIVKCEANNDIHPSDYAILRVTSDFEPEVKISWRLNKVLNVVHVNCSVIAYPLDSVRWYLKSNNSNVLKALKSNSNYIVENSEKVFWRDNQSASAITSIYMINNFNGLISETLICEASNYLKTVREYIPVKDLFRMKTNIPDSFSKSFVRPFNRIEKMKNDYIKATPSQMLHMIVFLWYMML
ncbi:hypothetical protein GJ496_001101 [Pomphorhynchus laevis]|nr:hypothetical protein GJ496_001101 [Pomphorhynchus laevis]